MAMMLTIFSLLLFVTLMWIVSRKHTIHPHHGEKLEGSVAPQKQGEDNDLVVASFNMHRARGVDGKKSIERIANQISTADIVGLYEVEGPLSGFKQSQAETIGRKLERMWMFIPTQKRWLHHDRGNAVISSRTLDSWYVEPLVDSTGRRPRALFETYFTWKDKKVLLLLVHMSRHVDQEIQFARIMDRFLGCDHAILMGDLNVTRTFIPIQSLLTENLAEDALGIKLKEKDSPERIDWILTRGLKVTDAGMEDNGVSDHPYYWISIGEPHAT